MKRFLILLALVCSIKAYGQFNPNLDGSKGYRKNTFSRDDLLWHHETARTSYKKAGNVAITTASRYGLTERWELSTYLGFDYFMPNIMAKYRWNRNANPKKWFFASRLSALSGFPGLKFAQNNKESWVKADDVIPVTVELGHEFIASRRFTSDLNCSDGSDYLILSAGIGTYGSFKTKDGTVLPIPEHFLANRCVTMIDRDFILCGKLWADWKALNWLNLHGGMRLYNWSMDDNFAMEIQAEAEARLLGGLSVKLGGAFSAANYKNTRKHVGGLPLVDIVYYFGSKKGTEKNLFNPNGKLY